MSHSSKATRSINKLNVSSRSSILTLTYFVYTPQCFPLRVRTLSSLRELSQSSISSLSHFSHAKTAYSDKRETKLICKQKPMRINQTVAQIDIQGNAVIVSPVNLHVSTGYSGKQNNRVSFTISRSLSHRLASSFRPYSKSNRWVSVQELIAIWLSGSWQHGVVSLWAPQLCSFPRTWSSMGSFTIAHLTEYSTSMASAPWHWEEHDVMICKLGDGSVQRPFHESWIFLPLSAFSTALFMNPSGLFGAQTTST